MPESEAQTRICPHCGREIPAEWFEFPPALKRRYGKDGEFYFPDCMPECQAKEDRREWEIGVKERTVARLIEKSEMPERLARTTLDTFDPTFSPAAGRGLAAVGGYLGAWEDHREDGRGLYLCGSVGSGKTHLACGMARVLMQVRRVPTLFLTAPDLLDRLRPGSASGEGDEERDAWASWAMNAELLVLDDLGAEKATEWARERIFVLVNHRYRRSLPTVYTSNVGPKELGKHLGERTASRIIETSEFVLLDGPDYRVHVAKEGAVR